MEKRVRNATGVLIRQLRNKKGWSQRVLARELNLAGLIHVDTGVIGKIEAGIRRCYDYEVFVIAKVLETKMENLFPRNSKVVEIAQEEHELE